MFLASACLCGIPCRYDGKDYRVELIAWLYEQGLVFAVCPESGGGLPSPRPSIELCGGRALTKDGTDCSAAILHGAEKMLALARKHDIKLAILKEKSPSCGSKFIYDGTFSGKLIPGQGLAAALLSKNGIFVTNEEDFIEFIKI